VQNTQNSISVWAEILQMKHIFWLGEFEVIRSSKVIDLGVN